MGKITLAAKQAIRSMKTFSTSFNKFIENNVNTFTENKSRNRKWQMLQLGYKYTV